MEKDNEIKGIGNSLDFGARIQDSRIGCFLSPDPAENEYPSISPYVFVADNPINAIDPDGKNVYLVTYATKEGDWGHTALAVENYRLVNPKENAAGAKAIFEKTGTVTLYELGAGGGLGSPGASRKEIGLSSTSAKYTTTYNVPVEKISTSPVSAHAGGLPPDGVIMFKTTPEKDIEIQASMTEYEKNNTEYSPSSNNCTDYALFGLNQVFGCGGDKVSGQERFYLFYDGTTPNKAYEEAKDHPKANVVIDAKEKTQKSFGNAYSGQ